MRIARVTCLPALTAVALVVLATTAAAAAAAAAATGPVAQPEPAPSVIPVISPAQPHTSTSETVPFGQPADPRQIDDEGANEELETGLKGEKPEPKDPPYKPTEPQTSEATPAPASAQSGRAAASDPFTIFSSTPSNPAGTTAIQEPTIVNAGNVVLATGNWWAQVSDDDGLTWPSSLVLNPAKNPPSGDRMCCDQVAYATKHGGATMFFWLVQDDCATIACGKGNPTKQNALTLRVYRNATKLLNRKAERLVLTPSMFGFNSDWFDFDKLSSTTKYLYIATDVRTLSKQNAGSLVIRIALDDLTDGDHRFHYSYWPIPNEGSVAPVEHAGSTMYLAAHDNGAKGDILRIFSVADSSGKLTHKDRKVHNFDSGKSSCPSPDGDDPCQRVASINTVGFHSGSVVGWLWTAPQDSSFPFPQVRVAVFHINSLKHVAQHTIYNRKYAFTYPAVGVNDRGELGLIIYRMGGGEFPSPDAFIRTDPTNWKDISLHRIVTGTTSFSSSDSWGDFAAVHAFSGCSNTFLASAWSVQGTSTAPLAENRSVWFGKPADGCPDLRVTGAGALPTTVSIGDTLSIVAITSNLGASAPASTTRFYLSANKVKSSGDALMSTSTSVPALPHNGTVTSPVINAIVPVVAPGAYRLLACADDLNRVDEVTGANNCFASLQTFNVVPR